MRVVRRARRGWTTVVVVLWAVALCGLAAYGARDGAPTAPEQISVGRAILAADVTLGDMMPVINSQTAVASVGPFRQIGGRCRITSARSGTNHERIVNVYVAAGGEADVLASLAGSLPSRYETDINWIRDNPVFTAMDGSFVEVRGTVQRAGEIRISLETGCRPGTVPGHTTPRGGQAEAEAHGDAQTEARASVSAAFTALGMEVQEWGTVAAPCGAGRMLWMVRGVATSAPHDLAAVARAGADAHGDARAAARVTIILNQPSVVAYRLGGTGVVVLGGGDQTAVSATTTCRG